ncbi:MAG: AbrB/MazE/SpoVT family DNA-binding domain-containing protein [Pseudomonadota bacterium]
MFGNAGNSLAIRIPQSFAAPIGLRNESPVDLSAADGKLVITVVDEPGVTLKHLLDQITEHDVHHEIDTGRAVGRETW